MLRWAVGSTVSSGQWAASLLHKRTDYLLSTLCDIARSLISSADDTINCPTQGTSQSFSSPKIMQDTSKVASELLSLRRPQSNKASNASNSDSEKLKMALAEKNIAEDMFATAFKEKEIIRLQAIKAVDLLKNQLKKSERAVAEAAYQIADLCKKIDADALHNSVNEEEIHNLQNRNTILRNEASMAVINQFNEQATWRDSIVIDKCGSHVIDSSFRQSSVIEGAEEVDEVHQSLGLKCSAFESPGLKCSAFESVHQISQSLDNDAIEALKHRICLLKSKLSIKTRAISVAARNQETEALANSMSASDEMNKIKDLLTNVQNELALTTRGSDDKSFQILRVQEKFDEIKEENKAFDLEIINMINEKKLLQNECATLRKEVIHSKNVLDAESSAAHEAVKTSSLLIKNLMSELLEKENDAEKLKEEQQEISGKMKDIMSSRNDFEEENSGLKIENKRLNVKLNDIENSSNVTSKYLTDEYISVCCILTETTVEISALHGEITEQYREIQGLGLVNDCLQNQLNQVFSKIFNCCIFVTSFCK